MEVRELGSQGLVVPAIGLGCMGMSKFYGEPDDSEVEVTLLRAVELGVTLFDTADNYGPWTNELLLGRVLGSRRDDVVIATKFGNERNDKAELIGINGRPEYVHKACDASLKRLGIEMIDLYYQHRVDRNTPVEETWGAMKELVEAGKVRYLGISEAAPGTVRRAHAVHPITALQYEYSLWTRDPEQEIFPLARELGIGLVPYSPLGRGGLTGMVTTETSFPEKDTRSTNARFQPGNLEHNLELVDVVKEIAGEHGATPAQVALAWVLSQGGDIVPIPGTKRVRYLEQNVAAADIELADEELERLAETFQPGAVAGDRMRDPTRANIEAPLPAPQPAV